MALNTAGKNAVLETGSFKATLVTLALFNGDPAASGTELSGGSYARKTLTWGAASSGTITATNVTFDVPAGSTVSHGAYYNSGGTLVGSYALSASETFTAAGTYATVTISESVS